MFKLITLSIALVFALVIIEIGLRIAGYSSPQFYENDDILGYRLIPGMSGKYTREGQSWVEINSGGFRDVEHSIDKPPDTYRVAVIGDSYVEALQVNRGEMFTNYVSEQFANCGAVQGKRVEMLTLGVSGYSTAQELLMLSEKVWKYSPDLVVLLVTTNNDISDNLRVFKQSPIPYFTLNGHELALDNSFREDRVFIRRGYAVNRFGTWLFNRMRFVQAFSDAYRRIKYMLSERPAASAGPTQSGAIPELSADVGIDNQIYREPADDNWRAAWAVTERLIGQMDAETRQHNARFVVVLASNGIQVVPNAELQSQFEKRLGVGDLEYPNRRLTAFCTSRGIDSIDLVPELSAFARKTGTYLHGFDADIGNGHWNQAGHKVAGEIIGRRLCELFR